ncbi:pilus assembly protein, partial [Mesorhizobium sp. M00.F.Ca.ET.158.01.1.1]
MSMELGSTDQRKVERTGPFQRFVRDRRSSTALEFA